MNDTDQLLRAFERSGGVIVKRKRSPHLRLVCPNGHVIICAHSPGRGRAAANLRSQLRREGIAV